MANPRLDDDLPDARDRFFRFDLLTQATSLIVDIVDMNVRNMSQKRWFFLK